MTVCARKGGSRRALPAAELIDLAYYGGMTHHELAEYLDLPLGTVKSRLRLGLQKLRTLWLEETSPSAEEGP